MFKGFQDAMQKPKDKPERKHDPDMLLVKMADELLGHDRYKEALQKFPGQLSLSKENYQNLCQSLLNNFSEFVQELPETRGGYFCMKGGILEHSIRRTSIALSLLRSYFLPSGDEGATLTQPQTLWAYAVFTAGILQGVGKLFVDLHVELFDKRHEHLREWSPLEGSMVTQGAYYKYDFASPFPDDFRNRSSLLLARQLMPEEGFRWIASNKDLFAIWLALLDDDHRTARNLGPILWRADALAIQQFLEEHNFTHEGVALQEHDQLEHMEGQEKTTDPAAGAKFLEWLKEKIVGKEFTLGDGPVVSVPGGVMITANAFQLFVREHPDYKNWQAVQTAFAGLGIHMVGSTNEIFQRYIRLNDKTTISGMVVKKEMVLPAKMLSQAPSSRYALAPGQGAQSQQKFISTNGQLTDQQPKQTPSHAPQTKATTF